MGSHFGLGQLRADQMFQRGNAHTRICTVRPSKVYMERGMFIKQAIYSIATLYC